MRSKVRSHSAIFKFQDENGQALIDKHSGQPLPIFSSDTYRMTSECMHTHCPHWNHTARFCPNKGAKECQPVLRVDSTGGLNVRDGPQRVRF